MTAKNYISEENLQAGGLEEITTDKGVYQHADKNGKPIVVKNQPAFRTDHAAMLLQVAARYPEYDAKWFKEIPAMVLDFFHNAKRPDGLFYNNRLEDGTFPEQRPEELIRFAHSSN